ncbi:hypothetical protein TNCT_53671 [Trichonephila clavata]|uniref:Uncharacterized protein n=1 Tax=Trichonephila clavata TaxID=2740835 RepID=A0A8X6FG35_TRICU|nr:hypothetical protein TNCT_53671 [Trichonephila clavata]
MSRNSELEYNIAEADAASNGLKVSSSLGEHFKNHLSPSRTPIAWSAPMAGFLSGQQQIATECSIIQKDMNSFRTDLEFEEKEEEYGYGKDLKIEKENMERIVDKVLWT